jgi:hypothetical protein
VGEGLPAPTQSLPVYVDGEMVATTPQLFGIISTHCS